MRWSSLAGLPAGADTVLQRVEDFTEAKGWHVPKGKPPQAAQRHWSVICCRSAGGPADHSAISGFLALQSYRANISAKPASTRS
jgi:hypothetical protein